MRKYEIYLPLKYNDGKEIEPEKIKQIREDLIGVFGAITVSSRSSPYQGTWKYGGVEYIDDIIKVEIVTIPRQVLSSHRICTNQEFFNAVNHLRETYS